MQRITQELLRKRSEHNECDICSLEEISLHQEDIGWIENIQNWCRNLKILLLHSNLISKIENVGKLKCLEYLNLSLNNIERIENLEGCESLEKLDLTLNFIGDLQSVENLRSNIHLRTLFLTGNPCADYDGYRHFVIGTLPQLKYLDGVEILPSERIQAEKSLGIIKGDIIREQKEYFLFRRKQSLKNKWKLNKWTEDNIIVSKLPPDPECAKEYWNEVSDNSPETRIDIALRSRVNKECGKQSSFSNKPLKPPVKLFDEDGRPRNVNEAKIPFKLIDEREFYELDIGIYKYLDSELVNVDVQTTYVRVTIKNKVFQLTLFEEIRPDSSKARRSATTGHLLVTMPKLNAKMPLDSEINISKDARAFTETKGPKRDGFNGADMVTANNFRYKPEKVETDQIILTEIPPLE